MCASAYVSGPEKLFPGLCIGGQCVCSGACVPVWVFPCLSARVFNGVYVPWWDCLVVGCVSVCECVPVWGVSSVG